MSLASQPKRGFCPRVWTPMQSGDGLIVRVHPGFAGLHSHKLRTLAALARAHGSGQIELTRRANLQLRGVRPDSLAALQAELSQAGWADPSARDERRFALLINPLAAVERGCSEVLRLAVALERALSSELAPATLHPKLCIALDAEDALLDDVAADICLQLAAQGAQALLSVAGAGRERVLLGELALEDAVSALLALTSLLDEAEGAARRMHELVELRGLSPLRAALAPWLREPRRAPAAGAVARALVGHQGADRSWFGLGLPFGSGPAEQWEAIAELAERFGDGTLWSTHRRVLILPLGSQQAVLPLRDAAIRAGLIVCADEPLLRVIACAGAPACSAALGETRQLARELALLAGPLLTAGATLHVSGCSKSCAASGAAELVLVHAADGPHLAEGASVAQAALLPATTLEEARARIAASAREYATSVPAPTSTPEVNPQ